MAVGRLNAGGPEAAPDHGFLDLRWRHPGWFVDDGRLDGCQRDLHIVDAAQHAQRQG